MFTVYLKNYLYVWSGETDKRFFNKRALVPVQVFSDKAIGHADNELVSLIAQTGSVLEPGSVV